MLNLSIAPPSCLYRRRALLSCLRLALESDIQTSFSEYLLKVPWVMQTCCVFFLLLYPKLFIWQLIIGDLMAFIFSLNVSVHCQRPPGVFVYCFWPAGSLLGHGLSGGSSPVQCVAFSGSGLLCGTRARRSAGLRGCGSCALKQSLDSPGAQGLKLSCSAASGAISD